MPTEFEKADHAAGLANRFASIVGDEGGRGMAMWIDAVGRLGRELHEATEFFMPEPPSDKAPAPEPGPALCTGCRMNRACCWDGCASRNREPAEAEPSAPVPMILHCPECRTRHVDAGDFATKPHHTHACQGCGLTWRPAIGPTVGVQFLPGFKDAPRTPETAEPAHSLLDALVSAAITECERAIQQARHHFETGERNADGTGWETCFRVVFEPLLAARKTAEPAPTRDESVPPPGWRRAEGGAWVRDARHVYPHEHPTAWKLYDAEHGYAPDLAAAQATINRLAKERDAARAQASATVLNIAAGLEARDDAVIKRVRKAIAAKCRVTGARVSEVADLIERGDFELPVTKESSDG